MHVDPPKIEEVARSTLAEGVVKERLFRVRIPLARSVHLWSRPKGSGF